MSERWSDVDLYFSTKLHASDPVMNAALNANAEAGLPAINVSPNQGKTLLTCQDERLFEFDPEHAKVAEENIRNDGLDHKIEIITGPALEKLPPLREEAYLILT